MADNQRSGENPMIFGELMSSLDPVPNALELEVVGNAKCQEVVRSNAIVIANFGGIGAALFGRRVSEGDRVKNHAGQFVRHAEMLLGLANDIFRNAGDERRRGSTE